MKEQLAIVQSLVDDAVSQGAKILVGGSPNTSCGDGNFYQPTVLTGVKGERAKRASFDEDEHTRDESREMTTDEMATSTTELTLFHSIRLARFIRFALTSLKMRLTSLGAAGMRIWTEEVFGPVMCIIQVDGDSDDVCVRMVNDCPFGLGSSCYSGNQKRAESIGSRLRSGMFTANDFGVNYLIQSLPFGGVNESGFDR